jgi:hypothetical protein
MVRLLPNLWRWEKEKLSNRSATSRLFLYSKRSAVMESRLRVPFVMLTVLRHPVERILSHFSYLRSSLGPNSGMLPSACTVENYTRDFAAWYRRYRRRLPDLDNFEVRLLLDNYEAPNIALASETECVMNRRTCTLKDSMPIYDITAADVRLAEQRLERMSLIGLLHRLDETMQLWRAALPGLNLLPTHLKRVCGEGHHLHCSGRAAAIDTRSLASVRELVEHDDWGSPRLWEHATALFDVQVRAGRSGSLGMT